MPTASKVKMSGSKKNKSKQGHKQQNFGEHIGQSLHKKYV